VSIERVAAADFTILIEGASRPEPHPHDTDVFCGAPLGNSDGEVVERGSSIAV
jgi:hypothetical protein